MPDDLVLAARQEEISQVHSDGVDEIVPLQERIDAGPKRLNLIWVNTDKSVDPEQSRTMSVETTRSNSTPKARTHQEQHDSRVQRATALLH